MVFRKDAKTDTFQRQISALRQQLGTDEDISPAPSPASAMARPSTYSGPAPEYVSESPGGSARFGMGAPSYEPAEPVVAAWPQPIADDASSVIAHGTAWNGELQASGPLHIRGHVQGAITANSDVFVAEEAEVEATVTAENLAIAGSVRGTIRCSGRLEILPAGRVTGDVFAQVLVIHDGATINGNFSMSAAPSDTVAPLRRSTGTAGA